MDDLEKVHHAAGNVLGCSVLGDLLREWQAGSIGEDGQVDERYFFLFHL